MEENYQNEIKQFKDWLHPFDRERLQKWEYLLKAQPESALCEAMTCLMLLDNKCTVEPFEDLSEGGVDFKCLQNGKVFYVEVTCITIEKVTEKIGVPHNLQGSSGYSFLTRTFQYELSQKVKQCSCLGAPCLVAIGTFHSEGGGLCFSERGCERFLTGKPYLVTPFDSEKGETVGQSYQETELESAAFVRPTKNKKGGIEIARCPISGVLLCDWYGGISSNVVGVLHPSPNHFFDRELLPNIKFGKLKDGYEKNGILDVEWI